MEHPEVERQHDDHDHRERRPEQGASDRFQGAPRGAGKVRLRRGRARGPSPSVPSPRLAGEGRGEGPYVTFPSNFFIRAPTPGFSAAAHATRPSRWRRNSGTPVAVLTLHPEPRRIEQRRPQPVPLAPRHVRRVVDDHAAQRLPPPLPHHARLAVVDAKAFLQRDRPDARDEEAQAAPERLVAREREIVRVARDARAEPRRQPRQPPIQPPRRQVGERRRRRRPLRQMRVAQARVAQEPLREVDVVARMRRQHAVGRRRRGEARQRRRHPPRIPDPPKRRRHPRAADAREEILQVHPHHHRPPHVRRDERPHAAPRNEPMRDVRRRNRPQHLRRAATAASASTAASAPPATATPHAPSRPTGGGSATASRPPPARSAGAHRRTTRAPHGRSPRQLARSPGEGIAKMSNPAGAPPTGTIVASGINQRLTLSPLDPLRGRTAGRGAPRRPRPRPRPPDALITPTIAAASSSSRPTGATGNAVQHPPHHLPQPPPPPARPISQRLPPTRHHPALGPRTGEKRKRQPLREIFDHRQTMDAEPPTVLV